MTIPATLIPLLLEAAVKYGPDFVNAIIKMLKLQQVSIVDVEAAFSPLKPYDSYNIPNQ